jgi:hypothetical protein
MNISIRFLGAMCVGSFFGMSCSDQKVQVRPLSFGQSVLVGGAVGAAEVVFPGQLFSYAMNKAIAREPFVLAHSYKGFAANALGQMPITAMQKVFQVKGTQWVEEFQGAALSSMQSVGVSFGAGVSGACIDTPSNAIQLYLQDPVNKGKNTREAFRALGVRAFRGFGPNAILKEGPFVVGYQFLAPQAKKVVHKYVDHDLTATAIGGAAAGVVTAVVTHPGAVIRNKMQGDPAGAIYANTWQAFRKIYSEEGAKGFAKGLEQRGARVAVAVPLYVAYTTWLEEQVRK